MSKKIENLTKEKGSLKREIEEKETIYRDSNDKMPRGSDAKNHYQKQSEVMKLKKKEEEMLLAGDQAKNRDNSCIAICKCAVF